MNNENNEDLEKPRHVPWGSRDEKLGDDITKMIIPEDLDIVNKNKKTLKK